MKMAKRFSFKVDHREGEPYAMLGVAAGSPFHCMVQASNALHEVEVTLFNLSAEDLRELSVLASSLADALEQAQHQDEQSQRPIEEVIR
jgi:glutamine synthetase